MLSLIIQRKYAGFLRCVGVHTREFSDVPLNSRFTSLDRATMLRRGRRISFNTTPFHLVTTSPWPLLSSFASLLVFFGLVAYMHGFCCIGFLIKIGSIALITIVVRWLMDVIYEGGVQGMHVKVVQRGLRVGFLLFIFSEILFFAAFFWAFFHSSLSPTVDVGGGWPPVRNSLFVCGLDVSCVDSNVYVTVSGMEVFNPWSVPFLNTLLLLSSGSWLTYAHAAMQRGSGDYIRLSRYISLFPVCFIRLLNRKYR